MAFLIVHVANPRFSYQSTPQTPRVYKCWCAVNPELTKNGPERDYNECSMPCAGDNTSGEHCGGFYKMLVYEITSYQSCHPESSDGLIQGHLPLSTSEDEQIIGQPWDFQKKYDTTKFFTSYQGRHSSLPNGLPAGSCDT